MQRLERGQLLASGPFGAGGAGASLSTAMGRLPVPAGARWGQGSGSRRPGMAQGGDRREHLWCPPPCPCPARC